MFDLPPGTHGCPFRESLHLRLPYEATVTLYAGRSPTPGRIGRASGAMRRLLSSTRHGVNEDEREVFRTNRTSGRRHLQESTSHSDDLAVVGTTTARVSIGVASVSQDQNGSPCRRPLTFLPWGPAL